MQNLRHGETQAAHMLSTLSYSVGAGWVGYGVVHSQCPGKQHVGLWGSWGVKLVFMLNQSRSDELSEIGALCFEGAGVR